MILQSYYIAVYKAPPSEGQLLEILNNHVRMCYQATKIDSTYRKRELILAPNESIHLDKI